jgi:hypothetical protein
MKRVAAIAPIVLMFAAREAAAERITVKVVDVAGDSVFVTPGRLAGLAPGVKVRFGNRELVVVETTETTAALKLDKVAVAVGESGVADVTKGSATGTTKLPTPRPLDAFKEQWPPAALPAATQEVTIVPLGSGTRSGGTQLAVFGHVFGNADKSGSGGQLEARVVTSFDILSDRPLGADLDAAARLFSTGFNAQERTPFFVRAAQLRYGSAADPSLVVGRLRYAATSVGMLDGGRVATHLGNFELAAFGGLVPDPVSGKPDTSASRFGAEMIYQRADSAWQPRVAVVAHGSTWDGQLDEQRLSVDASANHGATWLDGWAELQAFASDNQWGAPAIDLTGAGASAEWRSHGSHLGVDITFLRPERSLRLAAALPQDWLCARSPKPGDVAESCVGSDFWLASSASAGYRGANWSLDAVGSVGETQGITASTDTSGYVRGELRRGAWKFFTALSGGHVNFADWEAIEVGFGVSPSHGLDFSLSYRPESVDYVAATGAYYVNSLVADLYIAATRRLDIAISAIGTTGLDRDVFALLTTIAWRPLR